MSTPSKIIRFPLRGAAGGNDETVTFRRPFTLPGLDRPHRPGTFALRETRTRLDVSWPAYVISLSLILVDGAFTQVVDVSRSDLDVALARDLADGTR
jgi:hypothetical protein